MSINPRFYLQRKRCRTCPLPPLRAKSLGLSLVSAFLFLLHGCNRPNLAAHQFVGPKEFDALEASAVIAYVSRSVDTTFLVREYYGPIVARLGPLTTNVQVFDDWATFWSFIVAIEPTDGDQVVAKQSKCHLEDLCDCRPYRGRWSIGSGEEPQVWVSGKCTRDATLPDTQLCVAEFGPVCFRIGVFDNLTCSGRQMGHDIIRWDYSCHAEPLNSSCPSAHNQTPEESYATLRASEAPESEYGSCLFLFQDWDIEEKVVRIRPQLTYSECFAFGRSDYYHLPFKWIASKFRSHQDILDERAAPPGCGGLCDPDAQSCSSACVCGPDGQCR